MCAKGRGRECCFMTSEHLEPVIQNIQAFVSLHRINLLPSKPHPTALHNNSFCAVQPTAADTQPPVCLRAPGICSWLMQHVHTVPNFKLQAWNRVWVSIPQRNCTEKLENVITGVLRRKRFLETSPHHRSMTLTAWEGEGSGEEEHLHVAFGQGKCWLTA